VLNARTTWLGTWAVRPGVSASAVLLGQGPLATLGVHGLSLSVSPEHRRISIDFDEIIVEFGT